MLLKTKNYNKKADTQIDTIISIAIFVVYIVVIFFFIAPSFRSSPELNQETRIIEKNLDFLNRVVYKLMLYVKSNISGYETLIIDFPMNWSYENVLFVDKNQKIIDFYIDEGRMLFMYNLSPKNLFYIINSNNDFSNQTRSSEIITGNENYTTTNNFRVDLSNFLIKNITFKDYVLLHNFNIIINNASFERINSEFLNRGFVNIYKSSSPDIKNTIYVFNNKRRVYSLIENKNILNVSEENNNYSVLLIFNMTNFTNFYSDNLNNGIINYSVQDCYSFISDYVDFYDSNKGLSFITSEASNIEFCNDNGFLILNISFLLNKPFSYTMIVRDVDESTFELKNFYSYAYGFIQEISGIYYDYLKNNTLINNALLRNLNPSKRFKVAVKTSNDFFEFGNNTPTNINIYAKTITKIIVYPNGSFENGIITISTW
ncbi:MAG: hypothetical protein QXU20_02545 [Candidatus Woesearchaeota archaeon]